MLIPIVNFRITQQSTKDEFRENSFYFYNVTSYSINNDVEDMTSTARIILPKRLVYTQVIQSTGESTKNQDSNELWNNKANTIIQGDKIEIWGGYIYDDADFKSKKLFEINKLFSGYITKISKKSPIEIMCEDSMYILKKTPCLGLTWDTSVATYDEVKKTGTMEKMIQYLFKNTKYIGKSLTDLGFTIETDNTKTNIGKWSMSSSNSLCQLFEEIRTKCKFTIYFNHPISKLKGTAKEYNDLLISNQITERFRTPDDLNEKVNNLNCSLIVYNSKLKNKDDLKFSWQKNIIDSNLDFKSREDILIKLVAIGICTEELNSKKKEYRVEEVVGDFDGEVRTYHFLDKYTAANTTVDKNDSSKRRSEDLRKKAMALLPKYKMDRASGSFLTFGLPRVQPGNVVTLYDQPSNQSNTGYYWNGAQFLVKGVTTTGGVNGMRQIIELDYQFNTLTDSQKTNYLANIGFVDDEEVKKETK